MITGGLISACTLCKHELCLGIREVDKAAHICGIICRYIKIFGVKICRMKRVVEQNAANGVVHVFNADNVYAVILQTVADTSVSADTLLFSAVSDTCSQLCGEGIFSCLTDNCLYLGEKLRDIRGIVVQALGKLGSERS